MTASPTEPARIVREADPRVLTLFRDRWSPRAFDAVDMPDEDLEVLFDAARWAPSSNNLQPWRFLYAKRGGPDWDRFLALLKPSNQVWATNASVLLFVLSDTLSGEADVSPQAYSHSFDAGAAWVQLALQATALGYATHGMIGVEFDKARVELGVPVRFRIEAAVAIGRQGDPAILPDRLREREKPSGRKAVVEFAFAGNLP